MYSTQVTSPDAAAGANSPVAAAEQFVLELEDRLEKAVLRMVFIKCVYPPTTGGDDDNGGGNGNGNGFF